MKKPTVRLRSLPQVPDRPARAWSSDWLAIASTPAYLDAASRRRTEADSTAW